MRRLFKLSAAPIVALGAVFNGRGDDLVDLARSNLWA
jgi:hypothetical protein